MAGGSAGLDSVADMGVSVSRLFRRFVVTTEYKLDENSDNNHNERLV